MSFKIVPAVKLLLPLHKRINHSINIHLIPNIEGIIIDYSFIDFDTDNHEILQILDKLFMLLNNVSNRLIKTIICISIFDIIFKYFIIFKNHIKSKYDAFYLSCKSKLKELIIDADNVIKYIAPMINFKGNIFREFLKNL